VGRQSCDFCDFCDFCEINQTQAEINQTQAEINQTQPGRFAACQSKALKKKSLAASRQIYQRIYQRIYQKLLGVMKSLWGVLPP
jgi:hypothetical protein